MLDGAAFRVWRAEIEPADAGEGDGRGAHGAGLERDIEIAAGEPLAAELGAGLPDGDELGVCGRVVELKRAVAGACQHLARGAHHHSADGDLARKAGSLGLARGRDP